MGAAPVSAISVQPSQLPAGPLRLPVAKTTVEMHCTQSLQYRQQPQYSCTYADVETIPP